VFARGSGKRLRHDYNQEKTGAEQVHHITRL